MSKELEQLMYEERLRALGLLPLAKRRLWNILTMGINIGGNEDEQVKLFSVVITDRAPEIPSEHKRTLRGWSGTGVGHPKRLWSLCLWGNTKLWLYTVLNSCL